MDRPSLERLLRQPRCPVIVTCRPSRQGGQFHGSEHERLASLRHAVELGAELVDVELDAAPHLDGVDPGRMLISYHHFGSSRIDLERTCGTLWQQRPRAVKLALEVRDAAQVAKLLDLLRTAPGSTVCVGMGPGGVATRLACLRFERCFLTYAAPRTGGGTAPGQLSLQAMLNAYHVRQIGPGTRLFSVVSRGEREAVARRLTIQLRALGANALVAPLVEGGPRATLAALDRMELAGCLLAPDVSPELRRLLRSEGSGWGAVIRVGGLLKPMRRITRRVLLERWTAA